MPAWWEPLAYRRTSLLLLCFNEYEQTVTTVARVRKINLNSRDPELDAKEIIADRVAVPSLLFRLSDGALSPLPVEWWCFHLYRWPWLSPSHLLVGGAFLLLLLLGSGAISLPPLRGAAQLDHVIELTLVSERLDEVFSWRMESTTTQKEEKGKDLPLTRRGRRSTTTTLFCVVVFYLSLCPPKGHLLKLLE